MEVQEITLEEELRQKRRRLEGEGRKVEGKVHRLTRKELEQLVEAKVLETLQFKGEHVELRRRVKGLEEENAKLKAKAGVLAKQLADLGEVTRRVKEAEKEGGGVRIPRITRSVGLQVTFRPVAAALPALPAPEQGQPEEIVLDEEDDEEVEEVEKVEEVEEVEEASPPLVLEVRREGESGILVQWRAGQEATDWAQVKKYELQASEGMPRRWSKIGVPIPAKRLPMACNLNGFKRGLTYSFRMRMVTGAGEGFSNVSTVKL